MKKKIFFTAVSAVIFASCGNLGTTSSSTGSVLSSVLSSATSTSTLSNILSSVIGTNTLTSSNLVGTWNYVEPGCGFTTENLLAKAGGEVAATTAKEKLEPVYKNVGIKSSNTSLTFNSDNSFSGKIAGKSVSGTYSYNESTGALTLQTLLFSLNGYATANSTGAGFLFESKKLLTALQAVASLSGNSTLSTISDLSKNYDGIRLGFDMKK